MYFLFYMAFFKQEMLRYRKEIEMVIFSTLENRNEIWKYSFDWWKATIFQKP